MLMKKLMMMALMAAAATTAFAQDAVVKEAKKLAAKGNFDEAAKLIKPALTSNETLDKAAAWNQYSDIYYKKYEKIGEVQAKSAVTHETFDTLGLYEAAVNAWEAAIKCDEFDQLPDAKGKVKPRFRSGAQTRFKLHGVQLVQAGQFEYQKKNYDAALKAWKLYVQMKETPIYANVADFQNPKDPFYYDITYYVAFLSYQQQLYDQAMAFAKKTAESDNPEKQKDASEIMLFAMKDNCKTQADSLNYLAYLKEQHKADPEESRYFNLLMDYYNHANDPAAKLAWIEEETTINPQNKLVWAVKGETMMNSEKWDEAVEAFKKAVEIDPQWTPCVFNIGICLNSKAIALNDQLADKKTMALTPENAEKVKAVLRDALVYLEKTRELDPDQLDTKWAYPLYRIYYSLQDKAKMAELEAIDPSLKN